MDRYGFCTPGDRTPHIPQDRMMTPREIGDMITKYSTSEILSALPQYPSTTPPRSGSHERKNF